MRWAFTAALVVTLVRPVSAQPLVWAHGPTLPASCAPVDIYVKTSAPVSINVCTATNTWTELGATGGGGVPTGAILLIASGTCPAGYAEDSSLSGKTIIGTVAANGDVGTTGGSDTITPAGTNAAVSAGTPAGTNSAPTFTGNAWTPPAIAWPAGVPTFTGNAITFTEVINHTHAVTSVGSAATGSTTNLTGASDTSSTTATAANPAGGVASFQKTPAGTVAWPAGVPTIGAYTPAGSVSAPTFTGSALGTHTHTFTGTQFDNRSSWIKVIACKKT